MTTETAIDKTSGPPPREPGPDHTLSLMREGYRYIGHRCDKLHSDIFETRLMLQPVYCMYGREAAEFFYGGERFGRVGAMPPGVLRLLQDVGSVQQLDGSPHRHRKELFLDILDRRGVQTLSRHVEREWKARLSDWQRADEIVLFDEMRAILARAVIAWMGISVTPDEARQRTRELSEMIEATGSFGPRKLRALMWRRRSESWARSLIRDIRNGKSDIPAEAPAAKIALHREEDGNLMDEESAVVELLNILRPTVAIAHFGVFAAKALHEHPGERQKLADDPAYIHAFAEEVRRTAPFFPFIGGRARRDLEWRGTQFPQGTWMLLDLYGTNRDPRIWDEPEAFRPQRFLAHDAGTYELVPQGAGPMATEHHCPGEPATADALQTMIRLLAALSYDVPEQDMEVDLSHIPALPKSHFVIRNVRPGKA